MNALLVVAAEKKIREQNLYTNNISAISYTIFILSAAIKY